MARLVSVFVVGLLCGAVIVGALTLRDRAEPARAATTWKMAAFSPQDQDQMPKELAKLPADCPIETVSVPNGTVYLFYAC